MNKSIRSLPAIDVHAHLGIYDCGIEMHQRFMSGDAAVLLRLAKLACTEVTVVSSFKSILPEGEGNAVAGNEEVLQALKDQPGLRFWVVLDPRHPESFVQSDLLLGNPQCVGIKVHPEMHKYPIVEYGRAIFEFAAKHQAVVQSHSGQELSLPLDFVPFADAFPEAKLILSHLGFGWDQDLSHQVRAIQKSRHGNINTDTSSSRSLTPNLIEWAVKEVGADKILYGTDSPLYYAPMMRVRIDSADLKDAEKSLILRENAQRLLRLCV